MKLFIYGSLKKGEYNHNRFGFGQLAKFKHVAATRALDILQIDQLDYPIAFRRPDTDAALRPAAIGEVYELNLTKLDVCEMFDSLILMELGAQYVLTEIKYEYISKNQQVRKAKAYAFVGNRYMANLLDRPDVRIARVLSWTGQNNDQ